MFKAIAHSSQIKQRSQLISIKQRSPISSDTLNVQSDRPLIPQTRDHTSWYVFEIANESQQ
jgi:hypothetical protein